MIRNFCLTAAVIIGFCPLLTQAQSNGGAKASGSTVNAKAIWAGIVVSNLDLSSKWYEEKLGFHVTKKMDLPEHKLRIAFLGLNGFTLELIDFQDSVAIATVRKRVPELKDRDHLQGFAKVGFEILDVDALASELKRGGVKLRMEPTNDREFHDRFILVEDPDGNTLQFFQKLK